MTWLVTSAPLDLFHNLLFFFISPMTTMILIMIMFICSTSVERVFTLKTQQWPTVMKLLSCKRVRSNQIDRISLHNSRIQGIFPASSITCLWRISLFLIFYNFWWDYFILDIPALFLTYFSWKQIHHLNTILL